MLETIREFGLEQLIAGGEDIAARDAHAAHFLAFAEVAGPRVFGPDREHATWAARLALEHDNLRAALAWLAEREAAAPLLRLTGALGQFWLAQCHFVESLSWLERALAHDQDAPAADRVIARYWAAMLAVFHGDVPRGRVHLAAALPLAQAHGDHVVTARVLIASGLEALYRGDHTRATALHGEALALLEAVPDEAATAGVVSIARQNLGAAAYAAGDAAAAEAHFGAALARQRAEGYTWAATLSLMGLGNLARDRGDYERAAAFYRESLTVSWAHGDIRVVAYALAGLSGVAAGRGQPAMAARLHGAAEALQDAIGIPVMPAYRAARERVVAEVRSALPAAEFAAAWAAGQALPPARAVAEAIAFGAEAMAQVVSAEAEPGAPGVHDLTRREREVLRLLVEGRSDREIADALCITRRTASHHVAAILAKLDVPSRTAAATRAVRDRLV